MEDTNENKMEDMNENKMEDTKEKKMKDFKKIIMDMTRDILITFPELKNSITNDLVNVMLDKDDEKNSSLEAVFAHCKLVYPSKFFEILYQNESIFKNEDEDENAKDSTIEFLPGIDFKMIWKDTGISDKTRETVWKYLQLVLFAVVSDISDGKSFGDTEKLFEAVNQDEFKNKLEETIEQMQKMFDTSNGTDMNGGGVDDTTGSDGSGDDSNEDNDANNFFKNSASSGINLDDLPNPQDIHEHVTNMMGGKLGQLAKEIAEETAVDFNMDTENIGSVNDVFKGLFKNPTKLMGLVQNVGSKLDNKLKSGDMNETELLKEASEIMTKMKDMPGMQSMFNKMGMGGGGGGKMNMNAMQSKINNNIKTATYKDKLRAKLAARQAAAMQQAAMQQVQAQQAMQQAQAMQAMQQTQAQQTQAQQQGNLLIGQEGNENSSTAKKKKNKKKKNKTTTATNDDGEKDKDDGDN